MLADELEKILNCRVEREMLLAPLTTLGVGGRVECFVEPSCVEDFQSLFRMRAERGIPLYVLGGGSNVVFADGLIPGVLLSTRRWKGISWRKAEDAATSVEVQAGYPLPSLVDEAARRELGGLEFAAGIPGTVGGAIAGNAGAGGRSIGELLAELTSLEPDGSLRRWKHGEFSFAYRSFPLAEGRRLFLASTINLVPSSREAIEAELERFHSARVLQPRGERSAGCSFKNPAGAVVGGAGGRPHPPELKCVSAGFLLDQCECKGMAAGDAVVSERHANFILNRGGATAEDIVELIKTCQRKVFERMGVWLEPEVKFLGFRQESPCGPDEGKNGSCES